MREPEAIGWEALAAVSYSSSRPTAGVAGSGGKTARLRRAVLVALIVLAFAFRLFVAPYSSGSDIPQFAGFVDTLLSSGPCFYVSASTPQGEPWPYPWLYPYGPTLVLLLAIPCRVVKARPEWGWVDGTYIVSVPGSLAAAVKSVFIAGDAAVTLAIYLIARKRAGPDTALALAAAYALSPAVVYTSSIYGMFDQVAAAFLLAAVAARSPGLRGFLAGLALATKPTLILPSLAVALTGRGRIRSLAALALAIAVLTAPFVMPCPESLKGILGALTWRGGPTIPLPSVYSFSWLGSIVAYLYEARGVDYSRVLEAWPILALVLAIPALKASRTPARAALAFYLVFTASSWSVNYQYLTPLVALILAAYPELRSRLSRLLASLIVVHASVWPILYPSEFWFSVHTHQQNSLAARLVSALTLDKIYGGLPSLVYALILGGLEIALLAVMAWEERSGRGTATSSSPRVGRR